jgi:hypothetical protein
LIIGSLGGPISTILIFLIDGIVEIKKSHSFDEAFYLFSGIFFIGILIGWFLPRKIAGLLTAIGLSISVMVIYLFIKNRIHPFSYTRGPNGLLLSLVAGSFYAGIAGFITYCLMQVFRKKA